MTTTNLHQQEALIPQMAEDILTELEAGRKETHLSRAEYFTRTLQIWEATLYGTDINTFLNVLCVGIEPALESISNTFQKLSLQATRNYHDLLGTMYMLSQLRSNIGEEYTPWDVAQLLARLNLLTFHPCQQRKHPYTIYDPCCGSGTLLLAVLDYLDTAYPDILDQGLVELYGQEVSYTGWLMSRINLQLHQLTRRPTTRPPHTASVFQHAPPTLTLTSKSHGKTQPMRSKKTPIHLDPQPSRPTKISAPESPTMPPLPRLHSDYLPYLFWSTTGRSAAKYGRMVIQRNVCKPMAPEETMRFLRPAAHQTITQISAHATQKRRHIMTVLPAQDLQDHCNHANASILAMAPIKLIQEKGRVTRIIVGNLIYHNAISISCPDCGMEATFGSGVRFASQKYRRLIRKGNATKGSLFPTVQVRTVTQEVEERLTDLEEPISLEMLDDLLLLLLSMNANGAILIGHSTLWNGQALPIVAVKGKNITVPGNIGLSTTLTCMQCQQTQCPFLLISSLASHGPFSNQLNATAKGRYTRVLNEQGFFVFDLKHTGYLCDQCKGTAKNRGRKNTQREHATSSEQDPPAANET